MVVVTGNENKVSPMDNDLLDITKLRRWRIWKLKLIDARLYFVSIFVGLLTGLVAVPYHYLLQQLFNSRKLFFRRSLPLVFPCLVLLHAMGYIALRELDGQEDAADYRWGHSPDTGGYQWQDHL